MRNEQLLFEIPTTTQLLKTHRLRRFLLLLLCSSVYFIFCYLTRLPRDFHSRPKRASLKRSLFPIYSFQLDSKWTYYISRRIYVPQSMRWLMHDIDLILDTNLRTLLGIINIYILKHYKIMEVGIFRTFWIFFIINMNGLRSKQTRLFLKNRPKMFKHDHWK